MSDTEIIERLARLEQQVEDIRRELDDLKQLIMQRNGYMKWFLGLLITILSFVAAMFGLGWRPPP
ncbi:MAG: hypothetical protein DRO39_08685 [Thermoprotei archaeon]|nr:MAG: hypothetical protein DRO39_08685 [Thermoprotei archaeon]